MYDVLIIGAGVIGCSVARELSRYQRKVAVLERESDLCEGTSKANSGIVHAGFDAKPGSLKAKFNIIGNQLMEILSKELDFSMERNGALVLSFSMEDHSKLLLLKQQGEENGVKGLRIMGREELLQMEPNVSEDVVEALYAPTGGIVCPFELTIAMAENANVNGVEFFLNTKVISIEKMNDRYEVNTTNGTFMAKLVVNAAGVYADELHNMVSKHKLYITPRKGEYCLIDKNCGNYVHSTIFQLPTVNGKGVLVTPTVHGNLLAGPTANVIDDKEGVNTTKEQMEDLLKRASLSVKELPKKQIITSFAGLRASVTGRDFIIQEVEDAKGFIDVAGIDSPGLTSAPAIGEYVGQLIQNMMPATIKNDFISERKGIPDVANATYQEREALISKNEAYANVICRCELVTEGQIIDAIHRPLGATTLDGVKRRTDRKSVV